MTSDKINGFQEQLVDKWIFNIRLEKQLKKKRLRNKEKIVNNLRLCDAIIYNIKDTLLTRKLKNRDFKVLESSFNLIEEKQKLVSEKLNKTSA